MAFDTPKLGDNTGGLNQAELIAENLNEKHAQLKARAEELNGMLARMPDVADDEDTADKVSEAIRQCTEYLKSLESTRVEETEVYLAGQRAVMGWARALSKLVQVVKDKGLRVRSDYDIAIERRERARREEEARKAREEADRLRQEAEAAAATKRDAERAAQAEQKAEDAHQATKVTAAEITRTRTVSGVTTSLRSEWRHEVIDEKKVPKKFMVVSDALIKAAVKAAVQKDNSNRLVDADGQSTIPGVRIYLHQFSQVR